MFTLHTFYNSLIVYTTHMIIYRMHITNIYALANVAYRKYRVASAHTLP